MKGQRVIHHSIWEANEPTAPQSLVLLTAASKGNSHVCARICSSDGINYTRIYCTPPPNPQEQIATHEAVAKVKHP